jgi:serine/threonine-protein kinase
VTSRSVTPGEANPPSITNDETVDARHLGGPTPPAAAAPGAEDLAAAQARDAMFHPTLVSRTPDEPVRAGQTPADPELAALDDGLSLPLIPMTSLAEGPAADPLLARPAADLVIMERLGEGGMGVVHLARQRALRRDVAVKRPSELAPPDVVAGLIAEAQIAGSLEHPNIVPVHALGQDEAGRPVLIMKRIEGVAWRDLIRDPSHPAWSREGIVTDDRLTAHLEILMQIAAALHFAHSRGIVHRDLKPDNVMVGAFGEAYLIDWGSACRVGELRTTVGTPAYMAPEMLPSSREGVDPRTDVYLLGATLHEVLTGTVRHDGSTHIAIQSVLASDRVEYGHDVPTELADLCNAAMSKDKARRPPTAAAFRQAITLFLRHRGSVALADSAGAILAGVADAATQAGSALDVGQRLLECRFRFLDAMRVWDGNEAARRGLTECLERMIARELGEQNVAAARTLLADLPAPAAELVARIEAVEAQVREARERDARRARERDTGVSARPRMVAIGVVLAVGILMSGLAMRDELRAQQAMPMSAMVALDVAIAVLVAVVVLVARRRLLANAYNRFLWGTLGACALGGTVLDSVAWSAGVSSRTAGALDMGMIGTVFLVGAMTERAFGWGSLVFLVATAVSAVFPVLTTGAWMLSLTVACAIFIREAQSQVRTGGGDEAGHS